MQKQKIKKASKSLRKIKKNLESCYKKASKIKKEPEFDKSK